MSTTTTSYEAVHEFATMAHDGQLDKAGNPYIWHPERVAAGCTDDVTKAAALLHDVVEDTDVTLEEIALHFGPPVAQIVDALTKRTKTGSFESYKDYLDRILANPAALEIKLLDMDDNQLGWRVAHLSIEKQLRLACKYTRGRHYLVTGEWYEDENLRAVIKAGAGK